MRSSCRLVRPAPRAVAVLGIAFALGGVEPALSQPGHLDAPGGAIHLKEADAMQRRRTIDADVPAMRQVVRHFDFEELDAAPGSMPVHFHRYLAPAHGFPNYGAMRLSRHVAHAGEMSLEFEVGGGSMSARIAPAVLPILPFNDYSVSVRVRSDGLRHARARLGAWLHDQHGQPIPGSHHYSRISHGESGRDWDTLQVEIPGIFADAADLVFELQVLQPAQIELLSQAGLSASVVATFEPRLEDLAGRVWFDDVIIANLPNVVFTLSSPSGTVEQPQRPTLQITVSELSHSPLEARLRVYDLDGRIAYASRFPAPRGRDPMSLQLPIDACGWYRAALDITNTSGLTRTRWLDFAILPQTAAGEGARRLGVLLPETAAQNPSETADMLRLLGTRTAVVPIWGERNRLATPVSAGDSSGRAAVSAPYAPLIDRLLQRETAVLLWLARVPDALAARAGVEPSQPLEVLTRDSTLWYPYLDALLINYGLEINRWVIGDMAAAGDAFAGPSQPWESYPKARQALSDFVPNPRLYLAGELERAGIDDGTGYRPAVGSVASHAAHAIRIPYQVSADAIGEYLAPLMEQQVDALVALQTLPSPSYSARQQVADLLVRALHAWRAGSPLMVIEAPWRHEGAVGFAEVHEPKAENPLSRESRAESRQAQSMPQPSFAAWRMLSHQLEGRRFVGELPLTDGLHCWMLRGEGTRGSILVAWSDGLSGHLQTQLASGPVDVIDAFGNRSTVRPEQRVHTIALSETPVFIENANLDLLLFRSGLRIEPAFLQAEAKVHEKRLVLVNPWPVAVSGTMRLQGGSYPGSPSREHAGRGEPGGAPTGSAQSAAAAELQLSPSAHDFAIPPGGTVHLPLLVIPQRSILAGQRTIAAEISLQADQAYSLNVDLQITVGLENLGHTASWTTSRNPVTGEEDLVVTQAITNLGERPVNLDVYLLADGVEQHRRLIASLDPGETAVRTFRISNGSALLEGKSIRVGIAERDGSRRLNRILTIGAQE